MPAKSPGIRLSLALGLLAFALDRGHKFLQLEIFNWGALCPPPGWRPLCPGVQVTPFFDYLLVWNPGISYGLFEAVPAIVLLAIMAVAMAALTIWWLKADSVLVRCGLALCLGGALSHVIDRWIYGAVPDFFYFHWGAWSFYVFNISDTMITIGVALLAADALWPRAKNAQRP